MDKRDNCGCTVSGVIFLRTLEESGEITAGRRLKQTSPFVFLLISLLSKKNNSDVKKTPSVVCLPCGGWLVEFCVFNTSFRMLNSLLTKENM